MVEVPFYPCNPYNQPSKESKPRPISLASFPSPPNSPGTFHTPPTSPSAAVSARKRQDLWQLIVFSEPYYNVIFIPGKWHQRPALRKKKAAFFKRFNHQSSNSQPKLEVNLVAMVCLCSPEATCPSSLHLEGCLSPKPTSSSWPSSATPALYSQDRWFTFSIKFAKFAFMQVDCDNLITPDLPVRKISHDLPYQVNSTNFFLWHSGSPVAGLLGGGCQAGFLQEKHGL